MATYVNKIKECRLRSFLTLPEFTPDFMGVRVAQFLVFWAYIKSSTGGATSVAETAHPSGTPVFSSKNI
jgi:hypothetical protein